MSESGDGPGRGRAADPTAPLADVDAASLRQFGAFSAGSVVANRYRIVERLDAGGSGEVFRADDLVTGSPIALKVLYPRGADTTRVLEQMRRELRLVRRIQHPGVVRIHDIGVCEGLLYTAMDLLPGESLRTRLARTGRLPVDEARRIMRGILAALAAAHDEGVVHRDVKPANVMLDGERVVLVDFGLARGDGDLSLTATGQFLGTPAYVSPEQASGARHTGTEGDVYSAGIVLWEMLTGTPPFRGNSVEELISAQATRAVPAPARAMPSVPRDLRRLVVWMLAKSPAARPRDARVALDALEGRRRIRRIRRGAYRAGGPWRARNRHSVAVALGAAVVAVAALLFAALFPVAVDTRSGAVRAVSLFGVPVRKGTIMPAQAGAVPLSDGPWSRWHLVGMQREEPGFPETAPTGIVRWDLLTGALRPIRFEDDFEWAQGPPALDGSGRSYSLVSLSRWPGARDVFVAGYNLAADAPAQVVVFRAGRHEAATLLTLAHRGNIDPALRFFDAHDPAGGGPHRPGVALLATNHDLGGRVVLIGLDEPTGNHRVICPPRAGATSAGCIAPRYYTMLSVPWESAEVEPGAENHGTEPGTNARDLDAGTDPRNVLTVKIADGGRLRFDVRTGIPFDAAERGNLAPAEWAALQTRTLERLTRSTTLENRQSAAAELVEFARTPRLVPAQRGACLARAAELFRETGDIPRARAAAEAAFAAEPDIEGHQRLLIDLAVRTGWSGAENLPERLRAAAHLSLRRAVQMDLLRSALLSNDVPRAVREAEQLSTGQADGGWYGLRARTLIALHEGRRDDLADVGARVIGDDRGPKDFAALQALAALLGRPSRPERALSILAEQGSTEPFAKLLGIVASATSAAKDAPPSTRDADPQRTSDLQRTGELKQALDALDRDAASSLAGLYWSAWARVLVEEITGGTPASTAHEPAYPATARMTHLVAEVARELSAPAAGRHP